MNTVNTDIAPSWFPSETPEERVYWRSGLVSTEPPCEYTDILCVYTTERAAWAGRKRKLARSPDLFKAGDYPYPRSKDEVDTIAKSRGRNIVRVRDEHGNIVEEWTV